MANLFIDALKCQNRSRPPIWFMRQAGRYLPEYQKIRSKHSFLELCKNSELIAEVTKLPIEKIGFDAAILFSDILLIPEALGLKLNFTEEGPIFDRPLLTTKDIENLKPLESTNDLSFIKESIQILVKELPVPLIGFTGAPFTLASYMIEGKASKDFKKTKKWLLNEPKSFFLLLDKLSEAIVEALNLQIEAGAQALQIFDSWAFVLSEEYFKKCCTHFLKKILSQIKDPEIPVIYFCRGSSVFAPIIAEVKPHAISIDWNANLKTLRRDLPQKVALQGNLDPDLLYAPEEELKKIVQFKLKEMKDDPGYVFNLGHGIHPDTPVNSVKIVVDLVKSLDFPY